MIFQRYYLSCLAHASFLIGDPKSKVGVVVDPQRDTDLYLEDAEKHGLKIKHVILTHFHADFLAGHLELRERTGAEIHMGAKARAEFPFRGWSDGERLELGSLDLEFMETPGHTPESVTIGLYDKSKNPHAPWAILTGDTLFVGDVGRPDLLASIGVTSDELGKMLYHSLHDRILKLPDDVRVYPSHGAGSMCGKSLGEEAWTTLGEQRMTNYALQPMGEAEFIAMVTKDQPQAPAYFVHDAILNRKERPVLEATMETALRPLPLEAIEALIVRGASVVDVRDAEHYAASHLRGTLNIALDGRFATWSGTLIDKDHTIAIIADPGDEKEAVMRLGRIGFDNVVGYLEGGPEAFAGREEVTGTWKRRDPAEVREMLARPEAERPVLIDVRSCGEYTDGHIEGSVSIPLQSLRERRHEIPQDREVILTCRTGYRSATAASLLEGWGHHRFCELRGGVHGWDASLAHLCEAADEDEVAGA